MLDMLDMESDDDSEEYWFGEALGLEECLFCQHVSDNLEKSIQHMTVEHSFFIPDIEYLVDLEGFISHLGEYFSSCKASLPSSASSLLILGSHLLQSDVSFTAGLVLSYGQIAQNSGSSTCS